MAVAIVLAGGSGSRMNSRVAKQYMKIDGKEIIYYCLDTFQKNEHITDIVLVARNEDLDYCKNEIVDKYGFHKIKKVVAGGKERFDSVYQGLLATAEIFSENDFNAAKQIVMIHDGARPFVTAEMIDASVKCVTEVGACTVGVPVKDTIKVVDNNLDSIETPDRRFLYQIQTPQTFFFELIMEAYEKMYSDYDKKNVSDVKLNNEQLTEQGDLSGAKTVSITDDTMLVEMYMGVRARVISGSYENIKITTPEDIDIAEIFMKKK